MFEKPKPMSRILWLAYERVPHPDAVSFPAGEDDAHFVVELLSKPYRDRLQVAEQLRGFLKQQHKLPVFDRQRIPCRRESQLFHLIPWRLAKWLSIVLTANDAAITRTIVRIRHWLQNGDQPQIVSPIPKNSANSRNQLSVH